MQFTVGTDERMRLILKDIADSEAMFSRKERIV